MLSGACVYTLPVVRLTIASAEQCFTCIPVDFEIAGQRLKYWRKQQTDKTARWKCFAKLPVVLNADGSLWEPACLWLLNKAQARPLNLGSLPSIAQGLRFYKLFLDELELSWDDFSSVDKYTRPTYLYKTYLQELIDAGTIAKSTAGRRMSTIVAFYRFLLRHQEMKFDPPNDPWIDRKVGFEYSDSKGFKQIKVVTTTNLSIPVRKSDYAWDATIADGGKLRPLAAEEQKCLVAALKKLGNREYELMHYVSMLTGARVQTLLTLRWGYFQGEPSSIKQWPFKLRCGPGTGIDTKRDVPDVYLTFPRALYEMLFVYARSARASTRRARSRLVDEPGNYLFLTNQGSPYYESKEDRNAVRTSDEVLLRSSPIGQNLREFMKQMVLPEMRKTLPDFHYKFHDLRATFGMNWVDHVLGNEGTKEKYMWARDQLRKLMWHKDASTTDRYLEHRRHMRDLQMAQEGWSQDLIDLILAS